CYPETPPCAGVHGRCNPTEPPAERVPPCHGDGQPALCGAVPVVRRGELSALRGGRGSERGRQAGSGRGERRLRARISRVGGGSVASGDLDGDGGPDLAVPNVPDSVSVLLASGNGTFSPKSDYGTGREPRSVTIGDLNGDGKLDLAVATYLSETVSVLLGNGD